MSRWLRPFLMHLFPFLFPSLRDALVSKVFRPRYFSYVGSGVLVLVQWFRFACRFGSIIHVWPWSTFLFGFVWNPLHSTSPQTSILLFVCCPFVSGPAVMDTAITFPFCMMFKSFVLESDRARVCEFRDYIEKKQECWSWFLEEIPATWLIYTLCYFLQ